MEPHPQPYNPNFHQYPPHYPPRSSGPATASLILGISTYLLTGTFGAIAAVICGHIAMRDIAKTPGLAGRGCAIAGLILGYIGIALSIIAVVVFILFMTLAAKSMPDFDDATRLAELSPVPVEDAEFITVLPSDYDPAEQIPVAIWLHGYGASPEGLFEDRETYQKRADELGIAFVGISGFSERLEGGYEWSELPDIDRLYLLAVLDRNSEKLKPDWPNVALFGFSQGAKVAGEVAAGDPRRFKGAILFSPGEVVSGTEFDIIPKDKHADQTYFCFVGEDESWGNVLITETYANNLRRLGAEVEHKAYEGMEAHTLPPDYDEKISEWLKEILD